MRIAPLEKSVFEAWTEFHLRVGEVLQCSRRVQRVSPNHVMLTLFSKRETKSERVPLQDKSEIAGCLSRAHSFAICNRSMVPWTLGIAAESVTRQIVYGTEQDGKDTVAGGECEIEVEYGGPPVIYREVSFDIVEVRPGEESETVRVEYVARSEGVASDPINLSLILQ